MRVLRYNINNYVYFFACASRQNGEFMKKEYKVGLLGFGAMGKTHAYAISALPYYYPNLPFDVKIAGVCTRSQEKSDSVCKQYGIPFGVTDEDVLINSDDIDIIDICTPNCCHAETLRKAIAAGKAIYCEKPLCTTYEDAVQIAELAKKAGVSASMVFNNRFFVAVMKAKEIVESGVIGKPVSFHAAFLHSSVTDPNKPAGWKQDKDICGGGVLFDLGSHVIDMVTYLCGDVRSVYGKSQILFPVRRGRDGNEWKTNADEAFFMLCTMASGAVGTIDISKLTVGTNDDFTFEYYGTDGAIKFNMMEPEWLYYFDARESDAPLGGEKGWKRIETIGHYPAPGGTFPNGRSPVGWLRGHIESMYNFLHRFHEELPQSPSLEDGAYVQKILDAAYRSDETGMPVNL